MVSACTLACGLMPAAICYRHFVPGGILVLVKTFSHLPKFPSIEIAPPPTEWSRRASPYTTACMLFPYWPADKAAAFRDLRARGAFLVSTERIPGKHLHAKIHSLRGNPCRLRWPAEDLPSISRNGEPVKFTISGRDLLYDTEEGAVYEIEGGDQKW